ncbi:hypothetical protein [Methylobacillus methanolivorans]
MRVHRSIVQHGHLLQKFDSDTEHRFAIILERDASKWFKPAKGQFQIFYKLGTEEPEYIHDFVAETDSTISARRRCRPKLPQRCNGASMRPISRQALAANRGSISWYLMVQ